VSAARLLVAGASLGGLDAVPELLGPLSVDLDLAVVVCQHRHADSGAPLARLIGERAGRSVLEAFDATPLGRGAILLAPANYHTLVEGEHVRLSLDATERFARPSIDALFGSAARAWGGRVAAALLTSSSDDGARGLAEVQRRGGATYVQDPALAEAREAPEAALARVTPTAVGSPAELGAAIAAWAGALPAGRTHG